MRLIFGRAGEADAAAIAALQTAAADHLTSRFGHGHWSSGTSVKSVLASMRHARFLIGRTGRRVIAVACLGKRKPWAIDLACFTPCGRPLYLTGMAVAPEWQRKGIGRRCLREVVKVARGWPADALRLDAYDAPAGAGPFYAGCGFAFRGRATYRGTPHVYYELLLAGPAGPPTAA
jgi:GNAT superfamily N-acetyltransferase